MHGRLRTHIIIFPDASLFFIFDTPLVVFRSHTSLLKASFLAS